MLSAKSSLVSVALTLLALAPAVRAYDQVMIATYQPGTDCTSGYYGEQEYPDTGENQQFTAPGLPPGVTEYDIIVDSGATLPTMYACPSNTGQGDYTNCVELTQGDDYTGTAVTCTHLYNAPQIQIAE